MVFPMTAVCFVFLHLNQKDMRVSDCRTLDHCWWCQSLDHWDATWILLKSEWFPLLLQGEGRWRFATPMLKDLQSKAVILKSSCNNIARGRRAQNVSGRPSKNLQWAVNYWHYGTKVHRHIRRLCSICNPQARFFWTSSYLCLTPVQQIVFDDTWQILDRNLRPLSGTIHNVVPNNCNV